MFDELVGEKIRIVPLKRNHVQELYNISKDKMIWKHLPTEIITINDMNTFVEEALCKKESGIELPLVVLLRSNNNIVGTTRFLNISNTHKSLEIGWTWYSPSVWGTRINTECKYLLLRFCFETFKLYPSSIQNR